MKILQINTFSYKAAGNIMMNIHKKLLALGIDSYVAWGRGRNTENSHEFYMNENFEVKFHGILTRVTDLHGFGSVMATKKLLNWIDSIKPDIVHLHCIHGYYININMLFNYLREHEIKIVWTQHDCWSFTGHCAYFDAVGCEKWKVECRKCPQKNTYPISKLLDNSKYNWNVKKNIFSNCDLTIVTPSKWLEDKIHESFLSVNPCITIYNGIDIDVFKKIESSFRTINHIESKKLVLGVAGEWTERKGLGDFFKLSSIINDDYVIVLIGLSKKQLEKLPNNVIGLNRTENKEELVSIYNSADVFFNPTYEDNFPTTILESIACGTPVVTYRTGGCEEAILSAFDGSVVDKGDLNSALVEIEKFSNLCKKELIVGKNYKFSKEKMFQEYINLYERILS